jgi:hypothetical protein
VIKEGHIREAFRGCNPSPFRGEGWVRVSSNGSFRLTERLPLSKTALC